MVWRSLGSAVRKTQLYGYGGLVLYAGCFPVSTVWTCIEGTRTRRAQPLYPRQG